MHKREFFEAWILADRCWQGAYRRWTECSTGVGDNQAILRSYEDVDAREVRLERLLGLLLNRLRRHHSRKAAVLLLKKSNRKDGKSRKAHCASGENPFQ